jgi:hypothetical protein
VAGRWERRALDFVDDFNAWVVSDDVQQKTKAIQDTIIPHAERWASRSGATFEAEKTSLIHFTRKAVLDDHPNLRFGDVKSHRARVLRSLASH